MTPAAQAYLQAYLESLPAEKHNSHANVLADYFCASEDDANQCAMLVRQGIKRATCGLAYWYDEGLETPPAVGDLLVVLDWSGTPQAIVQFTSIERRPFDQIGEEFALAEGEGDKSLEYWRKVHWDFFSTEMDEQGREMTQDAMLVLEHFELVYNK